MTMNNQIDYSFSLSTPFIGGATPPTPLSEAQIWFIFRRDELLVIDSFAATVPATPDPAVLPILFQRYLGRYGDQDCFLVEVDEQTDEPAGTSFTGLRKLYHKLAPDFFTLAGRALQLLHWHRETRFCGRCGQSMVPRDNEWAKKCTACDGVSFPHLSPAVIMSIVRDDRILLARAPHFPANLYSTLAGFVEPGETLEDAVRREVREEVQVEICDVRYVASQPWPFPHQLMIGFTARYLSGEISIDNREIIDAAWFHKDHLPKLPSSVTIARMLIDSFVRDQS
jgi:NAD+ diphosphatase